MKIKFVFTTIFAIMHMVLSVFATDFTLVLDAGHGGLDLGASSESGVSEAAINLEVTKKAGNLCDFLGVDYKYTRTDENSLDFDENASIASNKVSDTRARVEIVNSTENAFLVSIHLNKFDDSSVKGAQVFYNDNEISKAFAENLQIAIKTYVDPENTREAMPISRSVYLMNNVNSPAILLECGFLSNDEELEMLQNSDYQTKIALCLITDYINFME